MTKRPRNPVPPKPAILDFHDVNEQLRKDLEATGATARSHQAEVEAAGLTGGLMDINDWIDQTLDAKDYIQAQEDREDFILRTGAGATKFNKWMKKAGLFFNKQTGRWTRHKDVSLRWNHLFRRCCSVFPRNTIAWTSNYTSRLYSS